MQEHNLENLRHSCAHLLAAAVIHLWPGTKNAIGPAIESGFYQDFDMGEIKISEEDFEKIEKEMHRIASLWKKFETQEVTPEQAKKDFSWNPYKTELIEEFAQEGKKITENNPGNFLDLCKGGHVENPSEELKYFKLLSVAGAYWRGSEKNKMLTRIYGTAFPSKEKLEKHLWQIEESKKRDHKKLGKELDLFIFSPVIGPGLPLLQPKGYLLKKAIEDFLDNLKRENGLQFVWTPHIAKSELYKQSKHWQKYDAMMPPLKIENDEYTLKPMNCPHHFQLYLSKPRSYRDLPIRYAENATVYRFEKSGEINGLLRVRAVTQDDSHWFVPHEKLAEEIDRAISMIKKIYSTFGLNDFYARVSVRDPENHDKYLGDNTTWDTAEKELVDAIEKNKIKYEVGKGEAAFYGPKIDFMVKDSVGREWQLTTVQLDFNQPENFDLTYTGADGTKKRPAILHIAFLGAVERFMAILIEHYTGAFPLWLAPVQVALLPISEKQLEYSEQVKKALSKRGLRVELDHGNKTIGQKIREATLQKVPYMVIIGDKETLKSDPSSHKFIGSVRTREGEDKGQVDLLTFFEKSA